MKAKEGNEMGCFPFFMNISGKPGLIIGGGRVALRKIEKLLPFGARLKVVAPEILPEIRAFKGVELIERVYIPGDENGMSFVIAAADRREINRQVSENCQAQKIPVNAVDDAELCTFIFPALVQRGELTVGISTSGASPTAAIYLKERINEILPENFDEILDYLHAERDEIKKTVPGEHERHNILKKLLFACMNQGRALSREETAALLRGEAEL